jgi:hypothetical protein
MGGGLVGLLLTAVLVAAVARVGSRRWHRHALRRAAAQRPGSSAERAIAIRSWSELDGHLAQRWCACGGYLERAGEGTREDGSRRYRIARLRCQECDALDEVYFDTTEVLH